MPSSTSEILFPLSEYWWFYPIFVLAVLGLLVLDLGVLHRKAHAVKTPEALVTTLFWVALALLFNYALYQYALWKFPESPRLTAIPGFDPTAAAHQVAMEFLAGFVVEKTLSLDNMFVFVVVFRYFAVPDESQHRVLFFGILGALVFRGIFIGLGSVLLQFHVIVLIFGALIMVTGLKIFFAPEKPMNPEKNFVIRLLRRWMPVTPEFHGQRFFVKQDGRRWATPLFVALIVVELSDVLFAIDSVPAIFALTGEPLIVFTSNVFAILGLRSLYFLLADLVHRFRYLKYSVGCILLFVGLKMLWLNEAFGGKFPIAWSLQIIGALLSLGIAASILIKPRKSPADIAASHATSTTPENL